MRRCIASLVQICIVTRRAVDHSSAIGETAWRLQPGTAAAALRHERPAGVHHPPRQSSSPGAVGPRQLGGLDAMPGSPPIPAHAQSGRHRHRGHQERTRTRVCGLPVHVLDACGLTPRTVRGTRLVDLVNTMDPKLVAVAFGMEPGAAMIYLADHVDPTRLPTNDTAS
jgi:hypothetical protein